MQSRTDYILVYDRQIFQNMDVQDLMHNYDHLMVLGCLRGASSREHTCYLGSRTRLPLCLPSRQMRTRADNIFADLRRAIPKPDKRAAHHNSWILEDTRRIIDERVYMRQETGRDHHRIIWLGRAIREALKEDRILQALMEGEDMERLLIGDTPLP